MTAPDLDVLDPGEEGERFVALAERWLAGDDVREPAVSEATRLLRVVIPEQLSTPGDVSASGRRRAALRDVGDSYALLSAGLVAATPEALAVLHRMPDIIRDFCAADGPSTPAARVEMENGELDARLRSGFEVLVLVERAIRVSDGSKDARATAERVSAVELARERSHWQANGWLCHFRTAGLLSQLLRSLAFLAAATWGGDPEVPSSSDVREFARRYGFADALEQTP